MDWLKEIEIDDLLDKDTALIAEACGLDILISLWKDLPSLNLYISKKPLHAAKRRYIEKFYDGSNVKQLCRTLNCTERFFYKTIHREAVDKSSAQKKVMHGV
jgi:hypothetical protein